MTSHSRIAVLAAAALAAGCGQSTAPSAEPERLAVRIGAAERLAQGARHAFAGVVAADRSATVSSRVMATVTAVHAQLGEAVAAGQPLVTIDASTARGQVAQAEGALAQARAAFALAERNHQRYAALAATGSASQLELDLARTQLEQARGAVQQAGGALEAAASVARESRVVAPFAGRVAARTVEVGDLATPGRPLMTVESATGRRLVVEVPEQLAVAAKLELGSTLPVTLDARPGLGELTGRIVETSPGPDPVTHSYTVKLDLADAAAGVAAGAAGRAWLPAAEREVVVVPADAIVESGGLTLVVVRGEDGRAQSRAVTLGARRPDGRVEVLSGLAGGERVALGLAAAPAAGTLLEEGGA